MATNTLDRHKKPLLKKISQTILALRLLFLLSYRKWELTVLGALQMYARVELRGIMLWFNCKDVIKIFDIHQAAKFLYITLEN